MFNGLYRDDVIDLKINLEKLGFPVSSNPTTHYGPTTEKKVKEFQQHYRVNDQLGVVGKATLSKIKEILSSPYQNGKYHAGTTTLKKNLEKLGFPVSGSHTTHYGPLTEQKVKEFQKKNRLPISGIADEITLALIDKKVEELQQPREIVTYTKYDVTLEQALNIQMKQLQQTDKYRNEPTFIHSSDVEIIEMGAISGNGVNVRTEPNFNNNIMYTLNNGTKVTIQGDVTGDLHAGSTKWYRISYSGSTLYVHSSLVNPNAMIAKTTANVIVRAAANNNSHIYATLPKGTELTIVNKGGTWHEINFTTWRNPTEEDVRYYIDPNNNDRFQHLVLSASAGVSAQQLNSVLKGKGELENLGQAFIEGGSNHSVNEIYLISHALLETGHGKSELAMGIEVGKNSKGEVVVVTTANRSSLKEIKTTYNMFGIGAVDSDPNRLGAIRAYNEKWFTPEAAIIGGAKFIGDRYIHNAYKQDTLYKMRWNPSNPGYPQYATDIAWATKQVNQINSMYNMLDNPMLQFNVAQYK